MNGGQKREVGLEAMSAQDRADQRWLEARELGLAELPAIDELRAEEYLAIERSLAKLPEHEAPLGWNAEVLREAARLDAAARAGGPLLSVQGRDAPHARDAADAAPAAVPPTRAFEAARPPRPGLRLAAAAVALAAAACAWLVLREAARSGPPAEARREGASPATSPVAMVEGLGVLSLEVQRGASRNAPLGLDPAEPSAGARRGQPLAVGDTLSVSLAVPGASQGELRLYREDGDVVARCASRDGCAAPEGESGRALRLRYAIAAAGSYRVVYLEGADLAPASGDLNRDLRTCVGCRARMEPPMKAE